MDIYGFGDLKGMGLRNQQAAVIPPASQIKWTKKKLPKKKEEAEIDELDLGDVIDYRDDFHEYINAFAKSLAFNNFIMVCILINSIALAIEVDPTIPIDPMMFRVIDSAFLSIYIFEFTIKNYANFKGYWKKSYNIFDAVVLFISCLSLVGVVNMKGNISILRLLRAFRSLRAFRGISFLRPLQVIVNGLIKTSSSIFYLSLVLMLFMYVASIMALNFFGSHPENKELWGSLGSCMLTTFVFVTGDNWSDLQLSLDQTVGKSSRFFSVFILFFGNLVFTNMTVGVIIQNLDEATEEDMRVRKMRRQKTISRKKAFILARQKADYEKLIEKHSHTPTTDSDKLLETIVGRLRHDDLVPTTFLGCNSTWMDIFSNSLDHQENTMYRLQQLHFEIVATLCEVAESSASKLNPYH